MDRTKRKFEKRRGANETALLARIRALAARTGGRASGVSLGIGDDAALFKGKPGWEQVFTCDWFLEGTHFLRDKHPPDAVGWKCLARAVSDVGAMGGIPRCFLLSLALPISQTGDWLSQFFGGLRRAANRFGCVLAGGDTTRRKDILINITVIGEVPSGRAILRSGAQPGDALFVSGRLGEAGLGLSLIRKSKRRADSRAPRLRKHLYPEPRLALGHWLAEKQLASAMMDLSDGLSTDLPRLCDASGVGARVEAAQIPAVKVPRAWQSPTLAPLKLALHGGDDYELLFGVPRTKLNTVPRSFHGVSITRIGEFTKGQALLVVDKSGHETILPNCGWDPFR